MTGDLCRHDLDPATCATCLGRPREGKLIHRISACSACNAPIVWAETVNGKRMPVDADPAPDGNVRLNPDGTCDVLGAGGLLASEDLHHSHFTTCPRAGQFRRTRTR